MHEDIDEGWVKLNKRLLKKGFYKKPEYVLLWIHLLMNAAYEEYETIFGGKTVIVKKGQIITGRKKLSRETGISEAKIRKIIEFFKKNQQISHQPTSYGSVINIVNWGRYQKNNQQTSQRPANDQPTVSQLPTNDQPLYKEIKEGKETKEEIRSRRKIIPPNLQWVEERIKEMKYENIEAQHFFNYWEDENWMAEDKKTKNIEQVKDWHRRLTTWNKNEKRFSNNNGNSQLGKSNQNRKAYLDSLPWEKKEIIMDAQHKSKKENMTWEQAEEFLKTKTK